MANNTSLLDVFQGFTRVAGNELDSWSQQKKYELDLKLYEQQVELANLQNKLSEDYLKFDLDGKNPFQGENGAQLYRGYVQTELGKWRDKAAAYGNGSKYYTEKLHELDLQGRSTMERKVYGLEITAERQRAAIAFDKAYNATVNTPLGEGFAVGDKLNTVLALGAQYAQMNGFNQVQFNEWNNKAYTDVFKNVMTTEPLQRTVAADAAYVHEMETAFPDDMPDRAALAAQGVETRKLQIWQNNLDALAARNAEYNRLRQEAHNGNTAALAAARNIYYSWDGGLGAKDREAAVKGDMRTEYDPGKYDTIVGMFPWDDYVLGEKTGGSGGASNAAKMIRPEYWISRAQDGGLTPEQLRQEYMDYIQAVAQERGMSIGNFMLTDEYRIKVGELFDLAVKAAGERAGTYTNKTLGKHVDEQVAAVLRSYDALGKKLKNKPQEQEAIQTWMTMSAMNLVTDKGTGGVLGLQGHLDRVAQGLLAINLNQNKLGYNLQTDAGMNKAIADFDKFGGDWANTVQMGQSLLGTDENGREIFTPGTMVFVGEKQKEFEDIRAVFSEELAKRLDVGQGNVIPQWQQEVIPGNLTDASANFYFTIRNGVNSKGENVAGVYKYRPSLDAQGRPDNKAPILQKRNERGEWEDYQVNGRIAPSAQQLHTEEIKETNAAIDKKAFIDGLPGIRTEALKPGGIQGERGRQLMQEKNKNNISNLDLLTAGITPVWQAVTNDGNGQRKLLEMYVENIDDRKAVVEGWKKAGIQLGGFARQYSTPQDTWAGGRR